VLVQPYNFGEDEVVDGYLAVILPKSFEMIDAPLSLGVIPESPPEGTYTVIAGFTEPGTLTPVDELFPLTFEVVGR